MTGNEHRDHGLGPAGSNSEVPHGPRWSFDDLADLHAGLLTDDLADRLRREISTDAEAQLMLAALDATQQELRTLPPVPMPVGVAARLDAALAAESGRRAATAPAPVGQPPFGPAGPSGGAQVVHLDRARRRRNQRLGWGAGIVAAAGVLIGVAVVALPGTGGESGIPEAVPTHAPPTHSDTLPGGLAPLALSSNNLGSAFSQVNNVTDYGPLENPGRLNACLAAVGIPNPGKPLGVRQVTLRDSAASEGKSGVLVVLPGGKIGTFRMVVVGSGCSPSSPLKLADTKIPGG